MFHGCRAPGIDTGTGRAIPVQIDPLIPPDPLKDVLQKDRPHAGHHAVLPGSVRATGWYARAFEHLDPERLRK